MRARRLLLVMSSVLIATGVACHRRSEPVGEGRTEMQPESPSERLARAVRQKLYADPDLAGAGSIVVLVDGRRVVLEGWVPSVNARTLAEADAATIPGVETVDNRLIVRRTGAALEDAAP